MTKFVKIFDTYFNADCIMYIEPVRHNGSQYIVPVGFVRAALAPRDYYFDDEQSAIEWRESVVEQLYS